MILIILSIPQTCHSEYGPQHIVNKNIQGDSIM